VGVRVPEPPNVRLLTRFLVVILLAGVGLAGVGAVLVPIAGGLGSADHVAAAVPALGGRDSRAYRRPIGGVRATGLSGTVRARRGPVS
jgi:hypothetical protein